ncbi:MAG: hypothetical protein KAI74_04295, partial [Kiritimatiellae bacterium]|nr:hypothetical protein [Kiritimatiellia bacterium]
MNLERENMVEVGKYRAVIATPYIDMLTEHLPKIKDLISADDAEVLAAGRNSNVRIKLSVQGQELDLVVKSFGRESVLKNLVDHSRGSKAHRTWLVARHLQKHGVGTPEPVAFMEQWQGKRLAESYFISIYQSDASNFTDELSHLFKEQPECWRFMSLMQTVADAVADMHRCGCQHNDLGNQNIMLSRDSDGEWGGVQFIDLNRANITESLSDKERARDISRIWLPSDLLRVFKEIYYGGEVPPADFLKWEAVYRKRYAKHAATRKLRHPVKTFKNRCKTDTPSPYPAPRDLWIWDERSAQPIVTMKSKDRHKFYSSSWMTRPILAVLSKGLSVKKEYKILKAQCYGETVLMKDRLGISIEPREDIWRQQLALLTELGDVPVAMRFYHHESEEISDFKIKVVRELSDIGFSVSATLVQDRRAVNDPALWKTFVEKVLSATADTLEYVEVGHAINRVKWGIWSFAELKQLMSIVADVASKWPQLKLTGPAGIDFEYPFVMAALREAPKNIHFAALSHHLYVDRRGAPENRQGKFDSLDKFAMARAIAKSSSACDDKLIISEVNWPLKGTGVYSPVGAPYESPGVRHNDPSVSEEDYANFMIRYVAIAISSGMVERVYWWRMMAHGFGLVDDIDVADLRKRPAFYAFKTFVEILGDSEFVERVVIEQQENIYILKYRVAEQEICLAWVNGNDIEIDLP